MAAQSQIAQHKSCESSQGGEKKHPAQPSRAVDGPRKNRSPRDRKLNFWHWFLYSGDSEAGWTRLLDRWATLHVGLGALFAWMVDAPIKDVAAHGVLPLVAILFGLAFAWVGSALAMISDTSFKLVARERDGGVKEYVFTYQLAVLVSLSAVVSWGLVAVGVLDKFSVSAQTWLSAGLFAIASLTVRECWQVVHGAHRSLIVSDEIDQHLNQ